MPKNVYSSLKGRVALVTGGSSGIGAATAKRLAAEGVSVGVLGRDADETEQMASGITRRGGQAIPLIADVSDPDQVKAAVDTLVQQYGRLDIVFANAGINGVWASLEELKPEEWDQTMDINLKGTFLTVKYAVPYLKKQGGAIVITSSVNGTRMFSNTGATAYACTKAGQVAFTKMVALELAPHKIRVNVICPGSIETPIHEKTDARDVDEIKIPVEFPEGNIPLKDGESGKADEVADLVLYLSSDAASHITGTEMWIDGGQSLLQA